jgi:hypothetical protein
MTLVDVTPYTIKHLSCQKLKIPSEKNVLPVSEAKQAPSASCFENWHLHNAFLTPQRGTVP